MGDSKLYSTQDIESLKQKIAIYKDTLNSLKAGYSVEDKNGTEKIPKEEYGERVKNITVQIESINQTVEVLSQDISVIMDLLKSNEVNDLIESINTLVDLHDSITITTENEKRESETEVNHTEASVSPIPTSSLPLSYKQFNDFFNNANDIQEISAGPEFEPVISIEMGDSQSYGRRSFPSIGVNTTQISNNQSRSFHTKPNNNLNKVVMKHATPLKVKISPSISFSFTPNDIQLEENNTIGESFDLVQNEAKIEEIENTVEVKVTDAHEVKIEDIVEMKVEDVVEIIVEDTDEMKVEDKVAIKVEDEIEEKVEDAVEMIIEDTDEMVNEIVDESIIKEQSENKTKNRDFLSFFNFFLKKS